jgi:putative nucleotidyltransferase with HDIG domain
MNQAAKEIRPLEESDCLQGDLGLMPLGDLLTWIEARALTGALTLVRGPVRKVLSLEGGLLVGLVSNRPEESQEYILSGAGFLDPERLARARRESAARNLPLGRYLMEQKLVDPPALKRLQGFRLLLALADALRWPGGFFLLRKSEPSAAGRVARLGLGEAVKRARELNEKALAEQRSGQDAWFETISQRLRRGDFSLPPMPKTLLHLRQAMEDPQGSPHQVLKIVMADQVLTSRILKVVNSAFYAVANPVTSVQHALVLLGFKPLLGIATAHCVMPTHGAERDKGVELMRHSFKCAYVARKLAGLCGEDEEIAFVGGLLHDIGKVVLWRLLAEQTLAEEQCERLIAAHHVQVGTLLAENWHLPDAVRQGISHHHDPDFLTREERLPALVQLANRYVNEGCLPSLVDSPLAVALAKFDPAGLAAELEQVEDFVAGIF